MAPSGNHWKAVDGTNRCPICDGPDNCKVSIDGKAVWCGRQSDGSVRTNGGGQHLHLLVKQLDRDEWWVDPSHKQHVAKSIDKPAADYSMMMKATTEESRLRREELAEELGVSLKAVDDLGVGWADIGGPCYTFAERDAISNIIGINRRFENGDKKAIGQRGLTYSSNWDRGGPLLLPEGGSDTLALMTMELSAIGRPSNTGGVDLLSQFIKLDAGIPAERPIIVIGEADRLKNGQPRRSHAEHGDRCECGECYPGLFGAKSVAKQLTEILRRPVSWALPPDGAKDSRSWLNAQGDEDPSTLGKVFAGGLRIIRKRLLIRSAQELVRQFPQMREVLIQGCLRRGETMNIIAASKVGKSWAVLGLALCLVAGRVWLEKFPTKRCRVLLIDNELHEETLSSRVEWVARQMGLESHEWSQLDIVNARGEGFTIETLATELDGEMYDVIILDAWYRFLPEGSDENSNADITRLYSILDSIARNTGAAFICVHHASKGSQSGKSVTDVGSGAGAQSRAPDTHLTIRAHEVEGAFAVDAAVRSFPPMESFVLRLCHPVWMLAEDLDPKALRQEKRPPKSAGLANDFRQKVLDAYAKFPNGETGTAIRNAAGLNGSQFGPVNAGLLSDGVIVETTVMKHKRSYDGFRLADSTPAAEWESIGNSGFPDSGCDISGKTPKGSLS